jgi:OmpA-OmpF porin, OOP family
MNSETPTREARKSNPRYSWILRCAVGCAVAAVSGTAAGADEGGKWYVNPVYGYTYVDQARLVDDDWHWGLGIGKHVSEMWSLELNGAFGSFDGANGIELDQDAYSLDALLVFDRGAVLSPFLSFGGGYITNDYGAGSSADGWLAQAGLGLMIDVAENASRSFVLQIRPEAKLRYDWADYPNHDDMHDYVLQVGVIFSFGSPRGQPVSASVAAPPAPLPVAPPPPNQDLDGDGVLNDSDLCPNTPRGTAVNPVGCTPGDAVALHGVTFDNDSATLTPASGPLLDHVAADLKRHPRLKVELRGYTDNVASTEYNLQLSQRRADAVRDYLISRGAGQDQLTAKGFGEADPIASNNTPMGRLANRRVVMQIADNPGDVEVRGQEREF